MYGVLGFWVNAHLDNRSTTRQENVLRFDVAVQDLAVMDMLHGETNLHEPCGSADGKRTASHKKEPVTTMVAAAW